MIQLKTLCNVVDNSGAAVAECVKVLKMKRAAKIGTSRYHARRGRQQAMETLARVQTRVVCGR